jgi:phage terminase large subunit-like protein
MIKPIKRYTDDVLSGKVKTGRLIKLAVERNLQNFEDSIKLKDYPFFFDAKKAQHVLDFVPICRHWKGEKAGQSIELEDNQIFYFANLFGWKRKEDGTRRFRRSFKEVARKNGKTSEEAIKAIYHIALDGEEGAQVYAGATKEEQARIVVNDVGKFIEKSPDLAGLFRLFKHKDTIQRVSYVETNSFITALGRDSKSQDGLDPSMAIIDEYHAHKTNELLDVIESGMGARKQPLMDIITTAGFDKQLPCYDLRRVCIDILEGKKEDESLFTLMFELDENDDWEDETNWIKSNPNLGASINIEYLRDRFITAKNEGGTKEVDFKTKNLNIWTDAASIWIPDHIWQKGNDLPDFTGKIVYAGLDFGATSDFTALVLLSEPDSFGIHDLMAWFWIPGDKLRERERKDKIPYTKWVNEGFLKVTPGNVTDYRQVREETSNILRKFNVEKTGFDPWNAMETVSYLSEEGHSMEKVPQNISTITEPTKDLERLALGGKLRHGGNPIMRWMMGNVTIISDANANMKISKGKSNEKIDGVSALVNSIATYKSSINQGFGVW